MSDYFHAEKKQEGFASSPVYQEAKTAVNRELDEQRRRFEEARQAKRSAQNNKARENIAGQNAQGLDIALMQANANMPRNLEKNEEQKPKTDKRIALPKGLDVLLTEVVGWSKVREETSAPLKRAADALQKAKNDQEAADAMSSLVLSCANYIEINENKRFKSSRRKQVVKDIMGQISRFFASADSVYYDAFALDMANAASKTLADFNSLVEKNITRKAGAKDFKEALRMKRQTESVRDAYDEEGGLLRADSFSKRDIRIANSELLRKNSFSVKDSKADFRMRASIKVKAVMGFDRFNELSQFYPAFKAAGMSDEQFGELVAKYGESDQAATRNELLDALTEQIMKLDPLAYDITSDHDIAEKGAQFENMSAMTEAYRNLIAENPAYMDTLKTRQEKDGRSSYFVKVTGQLEKLAAMSDYYRVRKMIVTDSEYVRNGGNIDLRIKNSDSRGTVHLKELMRASDHIRKNIDRLFERNASIQMKNQKDQVVKDRLSKNTYSSLDKAFVLDKNRLLNDINPAVYGLEREDKICAEIDRLERESAAILDVRLRDCLGDSNSDVAQQSGLFGRLYSMKNSAQAPMFTDTIRKRGREGLRNLWKCPEVCEAD